MAKLKRTKALRETLAMLPDDPRFRAEYERLYQAFQDLPPDRLEVARKLISRAAFIVVTLEDLEHTIAQKGVTSEYQNGENQWGTKLSPEMQAHSTMVKNYTTLARQLVDLLPKENRGEAEDGFGAFVTGR